MGHTVCKLPAERRIKARSSIENGKLSPGPERVSAHGAQEALKADCCTPSIAAMPFFLSLFFQSARNVFFFCFPSSSSAAFA